MDLKNITGQQNSTRLIHEQQNLKINKNLATLFNVDITNFHIIARFPK
jgi:hypothetical protein